MADEPISSDDQSTLLCIKSYLNHTSSCNLFEEYKHRLEELTQELLSAKKIIQLLQEDVKVDKVMNATQTVSQHTVTQHPIKSNPQVSNKADIWETVPNRSKRTGKLFNTTYYPMPIPVVPISNRFSVLHNPQLGPNNYQNGQISTRNVSQQPHRSHQNRGVTANREKKTTREQVKQQQKIIVIGDSHPRGLASELKNCLGHECSISGTIIPGARLNSIPQLAKNELATLTKSDTIIVWGGSNDVYKNETQSSLKFLYNFVNRRTNTNILTLMVPHRHDLPLHSCVNNEILTFNKKLHKVMKNIDGVKVVD